MLSLSSWCRRNLLSLYLPHAACSFPRICSADAFWFLQCETSSQAYLFPVSGFHRTGNPVCSSRKDCSVLWKVSSSETRCIICQHINTDGLKKLYRLKSNVCVCLSLDILVHISKKWRWLSTIYNTNNFHLFICSYVWAHFHLFMTKSITTFSTSTQAEELFVHNLKEKSKDNGLMQLEGRTEKGWSGYTEKYWSDFRVNHWQ